jgi:hypothetical protein
MTSVYELTTPFGKVRKQRFWDYFDGDALRNWWNTVNSSSTNTFQMSDGVNQGFEIVTSGTSQSQGHIAFNNIRPFSATASRVIMEVQQVSNTTQTVMRSGMISEDVISSTTSDWVFFRYNTADTNFQLNSNAGGGSTNTDTNIARNENWNNFMIDLNSSNNKLHLNGDFVCIKTSNIPVDDLMPIFSEWEFSGNTARTGRIRYLECYNL